MKTILFPTDFSKNAAHAIDFAVHTAQAVHGKIVLAHVYFAMAPDIHITPDMMQKLIDDAHANAEHEMKGLLHDLHGKYPAQKFESIVEHGFAIDNIVGFASDSKVDYIIMGTKGASNIVDKLIGSTAMGVLEKAPCPVYIIPLEASVKEVKSIMYASDYDGDEKATIQHVLDFAAIFKAETHVVHIIEEMEPQIIEAKKQTQVYIDHFKGSPVTFKNLHRADVEEGLEHYIQNQKPDIIAFAMHHRGFFANVFHHSITKHFVLTSKTPLLALHK